MTSRILVEVEIELRTGPDLHRLATGDCLSMHLDQPTAFHNPGRRPARYVVALALDPAVETSAAPGASP